MGASRGVRFACFAGILGVALFVAAIAVGGDSVDSDSAGQKVVRFYVDHRSDQRLSAALLLYGALMLALFAGGLRSVLRRTEEGLATVSFGGAIMMSTGIMLLAGTQFALADKAGKLEPSAAQALNMLSNGIWMPFIAGTAIFLFCAGIAIVRGRALPVWLGWVAIVLGVVGATPAGWFAFMVSLLWILVVAILVAVRAGEHEEGARAPEAETAAAA